MIDYADAEAKLMAAIAHANFKVTEIYDNVVVYSNGRVEFTVNRCGTPEGELTPDQMLSKSAYSVTIRG